MMKDSSAKEQAVELIAGGQGRGPRALWIDDEELVLNCAKRLLNREGIEAIAGATGEFALGLAFEGSIDLIVLNQKLPAAEALTLLRKLVANDLRAPVIVETDFGTIRLRTGAARLGAVACYDKPVVESALLESIERAKSVGAGPLSRWFRPPEERGLPRSVSTLLAYTQRLLETPEQNRLMTDKSNGSAFSVPGLSAQLVSILVDWNVSFLEFVAAARSLRLLGHCGRSRVQDAARQVLGLVEEASARSNSCLESRTRLLLTLLSGRPFGMITIKPEQVAGDLNIDRSTLHRWLRRSIGLSFRDAAIAASMRRVVLALAATNDQVAQIAYQVGYEQAKDLNRHVQQFFGTTPTALRRSVRSARPVL